VSFTDLTNAAMSNFQARRSIMDAAIKDPLVTQQKAIDSFIAELKNTRLAE